MSNLFALNSRQSCGELKTQMLQLLMQLLLDPAVSEYWISSILLHTILDAPSPYPLPSNLILACQCHPHYQDQELLYVLDVLLLHLRIHFPGLIIVFVPSMFAAVLLTLLNL